MTHREATSGLAVPWIVPADCDGVLKLMNVYTIRCGVRVRVWECPKCCVRLETAHGAALAEQRAQAPGGA